MNELIAETYTRIMGRPIDSKTMAYWANALVSGSASKTTFIQHLLQLPEYKQRVETMFKQIYFELVGVEQFDVNFQSFWSDNADVEVTYDDIQSFVKGCEVYRNQLAQQITDALNAAGLVLQNDNVMLYVDRIISNPSYNIETLLEELQKKPQTQHYPTTDAHTLNLSLPHEIDMEYLKTMEDTFGRALFVQEYFKYKDNPLNPQDIFAKHTASFQATQKIYFDYCNVVLTEWEYIRKYIDLVDKEHFEAELIDEILKSNAYNVAMKNVLKEWYLSLFDVSLDSEDLHYIFEKVQTQKLHLTSDGLIKILKTVKAETDAYIEQIFPIYQKVLNRQPDMQEISSHLPQYRSGAQVTLENDLIMSLEFHDILKTKIKLHLGSNVSPSKLYSILKHITNQFTCTTTMHDVEQLVAAATV